MFGKLILFVLQVLLFLILFAVGSVLLPFLPSLPVLQVAAGPGHVIVYDGVLLAFVVACVILLVEGTRKRLRDAGVLTTVAFLLAVGLGVLMRFGFKTQ